ARWAAEDLEEAEPRVDRLDLDERVVGVAHAAEDQSGGRGVALGGLDGQRAALEREAALCEGLAEVLLDGRGEEAGEKEHRGARGEREEGGDDERDLATASHVDGSPARPRLSAGTAGVEDHSCPAGSTT